MDVIRKCTNLDLTLNTRALELGIEKSISISTIFIERSFHNHQSIHRVAGNPMTEVKKPAKKSEEREPNLRIK